MLVAAVEAAHAQGRLDHWLKRGCPFLATRPRPSDAEGCGGSGEGECDDEDDTAEAAAGGGGGTSAGGVSHGERGAQAVTGAKSEAKREAKEEREKETGKRNTAAAAAAALFSKWAEPAAAVPGCGCRARRWWPYTLRTKRGALCRGRSRERRRYAGACVMTSSYRFAAFAAFAAAQPGTRGAKKTTAMIKIMATTTRRRR